MKKIKHSYIIKVNGLKSFKYYNIFKILFFIYLSMLYNQNNGDWGLGIGDWGLGIERVCC